MSSNLSPCLAYKLLGHAEYAAPGVFLAVRAGAADDILAEHDHARVTGHFLVDRFVDRQLHA
ncbi:hypothetical protein ACU4GD_30295 [Cupriavidus basilensis]